MAKTDLIAAFAQRHEIALVANANSVRISRLPHPALAVLPSGYVPRGRSVAAEIRRCVTALRHLYSANELERLEQLAWLSDEFHTEFNRDPSRAAGSMHPLAGALGLSYFFGAFVPRRGEHVALGVLRATLLRAITNGIEAGSTQSAVRRIRDILVVEPMRQFDETASPPLARAWNPETGISVSEFSQLLAGYFVEHDDLAQVFAHAALVASADARQESPPVPETVTPPRTTPPQPPNDDSPDSFVTVTGPIQPTGLTGVWRFKPPPSTLDAPPPDEIPPEDLEGSQRALALDFFQDEESTLEIEPSETVDAAAFEFEQATRHHLEGPLLPDTDRSLTTAETARLWERVAETMACASTAPLFDVIAASCAALMLVTGRGRPECLHAVQHLFSETESTVAGALTLATRSWQTTIPQLPELKELPATWFGETSSSLDLPLPDLLSQALTTLRERFSPAELATIGEGERWQNAWKDLRGRLRSDCARFTETRCIHTLAVLTFVQTGHLRDAQWLSGSSLQHSTAAGHYYAAPASEFISTYNDALCAMGIPIGIPADPPDHLMGAPRAALRWEMAREAVERLAAQTEASVRLAKAPPDAVIDGVYALGAYLAVLFGACSAHRFTASIGDVSRRDLITTNEGAPRWTVSLVADKASCPDLDARICVLPPLFTEQLNAYLRQLERLQRLLATQKRAHPALQERVRSALDGTGPLWFARDAAGAQPIDRHVLASLWPQWSVPFPLFRHLFASNANKFGIAGADIALQMGHSIGGQPFDATDPDSPYDFGSRISPNIQCYIEALGFRPVGTAQRYDPPSPLAPQSADELLANYHSLQSLRQERAQLKIDPPDEADESLGIERVNAFREDVEALAPREWVIEPKMLQDFLELSKRESVGVQQVVRRELATFVASRRRTIPGGRSLRRPFIPQLVTPDNTYCAFARVHFDAARWALAVEAGALQTLDQGLKADDDEAILAATAILLASYGAGSTVVRILNLLDPATPLHAFKGLEAGLIAEIRLGKSAAHAEERECQLLTADSVALVTCIRRRRTTAVTPRGIDKALLGQRELSTLIPSATRSPFDSALRLIGLARQCYISGTRSAWERGALQSVGPHLSRLASLFSSQVHVTAPQPLLREPPIPAYESVNRKKGLEAYRRLRRLAHDISANRNVSHNRRRLIELIDEFRRRFGSTSLIYLLAEFVNHLRTQRGLANSSAYEYLTAIGMRLLSRLGPGDIQAIDPGEIESELRHIAVASRTGAKRASARTVATAASHFSELLDRAGVEIDLSRAFDGLEIEVARHPGYFSSETENGAIEAELTSTTEQALARLSIDTSKRAAVISEAGALIQMASGLRLSEVAGLLSRDLAVSDRCLSLHVHPIKRRQLKTTSSHRIVPLSLPEARTKRLQELLERLKAGIGKRSDLLFAPDCAMDIPAIARTISGGFRAAASDHLGPSSARGHIARHNAATAAVLTTHPARLSSALSFLEPLAHYESSCHRLKPLAQLPLRLQFRYLSKQLGHSSSTTTLVWYAHALPLLHAQTSPWRGLKRQIEATLFSRRATDIDRWRHHHGGALIAGGNPSLKRFNPAWTGVPIHPRTEQYKNVESAPLAARSIDLSTLTAELAACVALTVREGVDAWTAAWHWGLGIHHYHAIAALLDERDRSYDLGYLTGRRIRPRGRLRIPAAHDLRAVFRSLDSDLTAGTIDGPTLRSWWLGQPRGRARLKESQLDLLFEGEFLRFANAIASHKRVTIIRNREGICILRLTDSDRRLVLLVTAAVSWLRRDSDKI
ncbi:tyrosine-type recombinase/integrase [Salinisphaera sp. S4-8]|uniref:tyrosine-type recombinase/integrase n=1 Tax=Salinisphaera sp. S4-8 TaxID=633357 RepID=UPI00333E52EB